MFPRGRYFNTFVFYKGLSGLTGKSTDPSPTVNLSRMPKWLVKGSIPFGEGKGGRLMKPNIFPSPSRPHSWTVKG
ncbi:hypothetical protein KY284_026261 [Solanum tuberosum]|nr:hypothetical protein KY284_026261 [Solanum tuberosum]